MNPIQSAGEALPKTNMTRRSVLKGAIAVALSAGAAHADVSAEASTLTDLIAKHAEAVANDKAAWERLSDLEDHPLMLSRPSPKVETSRIYVGRSEDGENQYMPSYSHSEEDIRAVYKRHDSWAPGGMHYGPQPWVAERRAAHYARMEEKIADLKAILAERERAENECGYTYAVTCARTNSEVVRGIEAEIIALVPATFREAVDKANWCVWAAADDYCYLHDTGDTGAVLAEALAAIGRAAV